MAVLVEAISVIIRRDAINARFSGGWRAFLEAAPNSTLCSDEHLTRVGFMSPADALVFIKQMEKGGLIFLRNGQAADIAIVDQLCGPTTPTEWLEFAYLPFEGPEDTVAACWLFEGPQILAGIGTHLPGLKFQLFTPVGWDYEDSLSKYPQFLTRECIQEKNLKTLDDLFQNGAIRINRGALFDADFPAKSSNFDFDRVEGMLLSLAVGDALGVPTEGMRPAWRRSAHSEIRDYIQHRYADKAARGFPSDDTQLAFWTLEQLIQDQGFVPGNVAYRFSHSGRISGIGSTVLEFLRNLQAGMPWYQSGPESAGNGALMRIAPILVPHLRSGGTHIWVDTALAAMMTHNDRAAISSCLAFVAMLWELLDMSSAPDKRWWVERYVELAHDLEGETAYSPRGGKFCGHNSGYTGPLWRFVEEKLSWADKKEMSVFDACNAWYSGAYLLETVPSALYILMQHAHDPEEAIVRAVNDTKDNDTIAAIVGAAVGALHGRKGMPERWIKRLSGRTTEQDDGHVFELIDNARSTLWHERTDQQSHSIDEE